MKLARSARASLRALSAHKIRALLALVGIAAGVAAVVVTSAVSAGVRREIVRQMEGMGGNLLVVRPAQVKRLVARKTIRGVVTSLKIEDYEAIATLALVAQAAPGVEGVMKVKSRSNVVLTKVLGTTPAFPCVRQFRMSAGRFFDAQENRSARRVAVLGARVSTALFGGDDPIGSEIRVRGVPYDVIGVLQSKGVLADGSDEDNQVIVPIRTALRRVLNATGLNAIYVSVRDPGHMGAAVAEVRALLRERHRLDAARPDDFAVQNTARSLEIQRRTADSLNWFATGLAAVALVIGGTGIFALMSLSVKECMGEIGLRMAVGATRLDIFVQFLSEASLLAFGGWAGGLALGAFAGLAIALGTRWAVAVPLPALAVSFAMAATIGLGFGAWPARQAARLPPIQALAIQ